MEIPTQNPCYFCEIIAGRADPWCVLAEDDATVVMLNGRQFEVGQAVVVPRRHAPTILEMTDKELQSVMSWTKIVAKIQLETFQADGVLLYQNNGVGSGQEVPHFHLHVVPRSPGGDWGLGPPHIARLEPPSKLDHTVVTPEKEETAHRLRQQLRGIVQKPTLPA